MMGTIENSIYLVAAILFILGLKGLAHPRTAVRGNIFGALAVFLAVLVTVIVNDMLNPAWIVGSIVLGSLIGSWMALKVKMTAMPQFVSLLSGLGGLASALVGIVALIDAMDIRVLGISIGDGLSITTSMSASPQFLIATIVSVIVGVMTFFGSMVATGKLQEILSSRPVIYRGEQVVKVFSLLAVLASAVMLYLNPDNLTWLWILAGSSAVLGVLLTIAIGGADMPIVISLLNSYSGLAVSATGFLLDNTILVISGAVVSASGLVLTQLMCKAMNRSLANVIFGGVGGHDEKAASDGHDIYNGKVKSTSAEEIGMILKISSRVVIVPGYGMAVARAQTPVRLLTEALEKDGIEIEFGIHPVAGRMPGHMNVLLAEEDIPYDKLKEMDQINPTFSHTDVVLVIGANDVVNPLARTEGTVISGMPILDVDHARTVIVIKRSLSPGFAGIPNPLFAKDNTLMFYADGKKGVEEILAAYKDA